MRTDLCETLLTQWCERLLELQITEHSAPGLYGGILCPACACVHGRCFEAIYPFLYLADVRRDERFLDGAKLLYEWAERTVSCPDGSYRNDMHSDWKGTTVFGVIALAEALTFHSHVLDEEAHSRWLKRLEKAGQFLSGCKELLCNNINYRITNALALQYLSQLLSVPAYAVQASQIMEEAVCFITAEGILYGEGVPNHKATARGCRPVDIGYNVEESLPALAMYARLTKDEQLEQLAAKALHAQLIFMLPDGGWDNSFGTRNYKWTYWGSRTTDGAALAYLLMAGHEPAFHTAAQRSLELLQHCSREGLLDGGPHYASMGEYACVHHTFAHAKVLAGILDHHLTVAENLPPLPRVSTTGITHLPSIDTYLVNSGGMLATLTASDWEYLPGGHTSGGCLSLLWHPAAGPLLCASMSEYQLKEPDNMQLPRFSHHRCISPALEYLEQNCRYTTLYDYEAEISRPDSQKDWLNVKGSLFNMEHKYPQFRIQHQTDYCFSPDGVTVKIAVNNPSVFYRCPLISMDGEEIIWDEQQLIIHRASAHITLTVRKGALKLPLGSTRCYQLVPGFQAVEAVILPQELEFEFTITVSERSI